MRMRARAAATSAIVSHRHDDYHVEDAMDGMRRWWWWQLGDWEVTLLSRNQMFAYISTDGHDFKK